MFLDKIHLVVVVVGGGDELLTFCEFFLSNSLSTAARLCIVAVELIVWCQISTTTVSVLKISQQAYVNAAVEISLSHRSQ